MLFSYSSALLDSLISDYRRLPCPSPCNGLISTRLLQRTPRRCFGVSSRSAVRCHEGRRTPPPRTSSEKPHDRRDLHETALARHSHTNRLLTLCAGFPVPARVCTSLSCRLLTWRHMVGELSARLALLPGTVSQLRFVNRRP